MYTMKSVIKSVSVRNFRNNIAKYLNELPIFLTKHGKVIAKVNLVEKELERLGEDGNELIKQKMIEIVRSKPNHPGLCKHGRAQG